MSLRIYVRDRDRERVAQLEDFQQADFVSRFNDVGTWAIELDRRVAAAIGLTTPGYGIEAVRDSDGHTILAGPLRVRKHERDADSQHIAVTGWDDMVHLQRRLAHPQPGTAAPPYGVEADVRTDIASLIIDAYVDINAGPTALAPRRVAGLTVPSGVSVGAEITGRARWQNLLVLLQELAVSGGGVGFHVLQSGTDLEFRCYQPEDKTASVIFSHELGNLARYEYESTAPEATYWVVGGGGEGTARTIYEGQDSTALATWDRIETFVDRRDTTDGSELEQEISKQIQEMGERGTLAATPLDTAGMAYGEHYDLGDRVTVMVDETPVEEIIREVRITLTENGPQRTIPVIGTVGRHEVFGILRDFRVLAARLANIERR